MKRQILFLIIVALCANTNLFSQKKESTSLPKKKKLAFEDARDFKYIKSLKMSSWGNWVAYETSPDWGEGWTTIVSTKDTHKHFTIQRGNRFAFPMNSENWFAAIVQPKLYEIENSKGEKDKPKSSLEIVKLKDFESRTIEKVKNYKFSNDGKWLVYEKDEEIEKDKNLKYKPIGNNIG
ncbi:MAG TPA: hypothetical protein PKV40_06175, partial [Candidatus Kapabacteria bacterium]|nr:hypothetical protein [Candidatus Kapabacteria bacterium]